MTETQGPEGQTQGTMSFREHLGELRKRLFRATVAVVLGFFVAWNFHIELYALLSEPVRTALANNNLYAIKALQITESIEVYMKISLFGGLLLASPMVFYQMWAFVAPGLLDKEKRLITPVIAGSVACFLLGAAFAHLVVLPFMTDFLIRLTMEAPGMTLEPTLSSTVSFSVLMLVAFGAVFELPLFMYVLAALGLVSAKGFLGFYRYWVVIAFIIGAVLTPTPDPINQSLMSAPLIVLYGVGVIIAWLVQREPAGAGRRVPRRSVMAVAAVLVLLAGAAVSYILRDRESGPLDDVPADVRQLLGVHRAGLTRFQQNVTPGSAAAVGLAPLALLEALDVKLKDPQLLLARFDDGAALIVQVDDAKAVVQRVAKLRQASVVRTASGPSVWFPVPGGPSWRAVASSAHVLWLGDDGGLAHLSAVKQKRKPALIQDKGVEQRLADLRSGGPVWSYVPSPQGIAGWLPGGALANTVRLASAVLERDKRELTVRFECMGPEAAIALRDRIESWAADSRRTATRPSDRHVQELSTRVQELAQVMARAADASSRLAPPNSPDRATLEAGSARAFQLARELAGLGPGATPRHPDSPGPQREAEAAQAGHDESSVLMQALQPPAVSTTTAVATAVTWTVQGDMGRLLDLLTAPASTGLAPEALRALKLVLRPAVAVKAPTALPIPPRQVMNPQKLPAAEAAP